MITPLTLPEMEAMSKEEVENHVMVLQMEAERKQKQVHNLRERRKKHWETITNAAIKLLDEFDGDTKKVADILGFDEAAVKRLKEPEVAKLYKKY